MKNWLFFGLGVLVLALQAEPPCANVGLRKHVADPAYWKALQLTEEQLLTYAQTIRHDPDSILTIPVVFHILHTGEAIGAGSNISDARILGALLTTNRVWHDTVDRGADMAVQFCLAQTDPNGNPTNGIVRIDASSVPRYTNEGINYSGTLGADELALKSLSNWPHDRYYNIWVVNKIDGGWAGFAYYPTGSNFSVDGTIIAAGSVKAGNEVLAHELGHGLGLYHTFQGDDNGCPLNDNCATQGDRVCDTPPHQTYDCIFSPCASGDLSNSITNIMSYCSLSRLLFTEGQKTRSRNAIFSTTRLALLSATVCQFSCPAIQTELQASTCAADSAGILSDTLQAASGCDSIVRTTWLYLPAPAADLAYAFSGPFTADFSMPLTPGNGTTILWDFGDGNTSAALQPQHTYAAPGNYIVTLTLSNACGVSVDSQALSIVSTGVRTDPVQKVSVWPNPNSGAFLITGLGLSGSVQLRVYDMLGRAVFVREMPGGGDLPVDLSGIEPGVYVLQVFRADERVATARLLIR